MAEKKKLSDLFDELADEEPPKDAPKKEEPKVDNPVITKEDKPEEKKKMTFDDMPPKRKSPFDPEEPVKENPVKIPVPEVSKVSFFKKKSPEIEFDLSPARALVKHVIMIYGNKGEGKTSLGLSFPASHVALSFDQKTESVRQSSKYKDDILVFDGTRYLDKSSPDEWLESSDRTWRYINKLLDSIPDIDEGKETSAPSLVIKQEGDYREYIKGNPDWFTVDAGEVFETIAEMVMRSRNGIMAFEGFANKNLWKERRMYIDQLLRKCIRKSKKGVLWTSYVQKDEIVENGEFVAKKDIPKYIDAVLRETDVVIRVERTTGRNGQQFFATVESSKWDRIPETGKTDITKKGIEALTKGEI